MKLCFEYLGGLYLKNGEGKTFGHPRGVLKLGHGNSSFLKILSSKFLNYDLVKENFTLFCAHDDF